LIRTLTAVDSTQRNIGSNRRPAGSIIRATPGMFNHLFAWIESTAFSVWMRESPSIFSFPIILAVHTIGLGLLAGINVALDLRGP